MEIMIDRQKFNTFIEDSSRDYCTSAPFFPRSKVSDMVSLSHRTRSSATYSNPRSQGVNGLGTT